MLVTVSCPEFLDKNKDKKENIFSFKSCINVLARCCGSVSVNCAVKYLLVTTNKVALRWLSWGIGWLTAHSQLSLEPRGCVYNTCTGLNKELLFSNLNC